MDDILGGDRDPANVILAVDGLPVEGPGRGDDPHGGIGLRAQADGPAGVFGSLAAQIVIIEGALKKGIVTGTVVVADMNDDTVRHQIFGDQFDTQLIGHFPDDQAGLFIIIGFGQDLTGLHRMADRCEGLDPGHGTGLQSPGVVDQELRVDTEKLIKELFVGQGHGGNIPHGKDALGREGPGGAAADLPEIGQGHMVPEQEPVGHGRQLGDPYAVRVGLHAFGNDIHGDLGQVHIGADAAGRGDAGGGEDIPDHGHGQFMGRHAVKGQVVGDIDKNFIHGIHMDIFRRYIFQINPIDPGSTAGVFCHLGNSGYIVDLPAGTDFRLPDLLFGFE